MLHWVEPRHLDIVLDLQKPEVQDLVSEGRQGTCTNKSFILGREVEEGGKEEQREKWRGAEGERKGWRGTEGEREGGRTDSWRKVEMERGWE